MGSGKYQNASEVLREGLRLIEQRDQEQALQLEVLRKAVSLGLADFEEHRFAEVREDEISDFVATLGKEAHVFAKKK